MKSVKATEELNKKLFEEYRQNKKEFLQFLTWKTSLKLRQFRHINNSRHNTNDKLNNINITNNNNSDNKRMVWRKKRKKPNKNIGKQSLKFTYNGLKWFPEDIIYNENKYYAEKVKDRASLNPDRITMNLEAIWKAIGKLEQMLKTSVILQDNKVKQKNKQLSMAK